MGGKDLLMPHDYQQMLRRVVCVVVLLLLDIGEDSRDSLAWYNILSPRLSEDTPVCTHHHLPGQGGTLSFFWYSGGFAGGMFLPRAEGWTEGGEGPGGLQG